MFPAKVMCPGGAIKRKGDSSRPRCFVFNFDRSAK